MYYRYVGAGEYTLSSPPSEDMHKLLELLEVCRNTISSVDKMFRRTINEETLAVSLSAIKKSALSSVVYTWGSPLFEHTSY